MKQTKTILIDSRIKKDFHEKIIDYVKTMILKDGIYKIGYSYYNIEIADDYNILITINYYRPDAIIKYNTYVVQV